MMRRGFLLAGLLFVVFLCLQQGLNGGASAQGGTRLVGAARVRVPGMDVWAAVDDAGQLWMQPSSLNPYDWQKTGQAPGRPAALTSGYNNELILTLENGDIYTVETSSPTFMWTLTFVGNPLAQPVPIVRTTWGRIKAERR